MLDLFRTLLRPDREGNPEESVVARAATVLQVGEFQFLQLAYNHWYGAEMSPAECDLLFRAYMLHGQIPTWARHYARSVLEAEARGRLNDKDPDFHRYDHNYVTHVPNGVRHFTLATMFLAVVLVGGLLLSELAGGEATSVLPPYFSPDELQSSR